MCEIIAVWDVGDATQAIMVSREAINPVHEGEYHMAMTTGRMKSVVTASLVAVLALTLFAGAAFANNGKGNSARSVAEPAVITEVSAEVADPSASNFEEEFTYYVVRFEDIDHAEWTYREPVRLGGNGDVSMEWNATSSAFWFGVTAPDGDGIQHEIKHKGQVSMYYETADGDVYSIIAQFNGKGELKHVNGVAPSN